jgi:predicted nucleic acid-binding protein
MKYLLDVNALLAAIIQHHVSHDVVDSWVRDKQLAVCPFSELGFLRIATHPNAYNVKMTIAREALQSFMVNNRTAFIPADLPALRASAKKSADVTDSYLAELASRHKMKLATLGAGIDHPAAELIQ